MNTLLPSTATDEANSPILKLIDRLCKLVTDETEALTAGRQFNLEELNRRKNHAVLELRQLTQPGREEPENNPILRERLGQLQVLLQQNETVLQRHLNAARQISAMLGQAVAEQDSDGTYSPSSAIGHSR